MPIPSVNAPAFSKWWLLGPDRRTERRWSHPAQGKVQILYPLYFVSLRMTANPLPVSGMHHTCDSVQHHWAGASGRLGSDGITRRTAQDLLRIPPDAANHSARAGWGNLDRGGGETHT